ncbi:MAG: squalene/phytoene synthase family protein [Thermoanaerobaculia bacterium]|nr:squalene/phytoene synthase family protein [Thermoanaerobaculia bacterium]
MADLDELLEKTSRTFALSIPLLPEPTRQHVVLGYLLFRIADTFEDAARWPRRKRVAALEAFARLLEDDSRGNGEAAELAAIWANEVPIDHEGYRELLSETPAVLEAFFALEEPARSLVRDHVQRTARGMASYVERTDDEGELELETLDDLRDYCYIVAGIVGEMLTELFLLGRPELAPKAVYLRSRSRRCGEAQQLVNILKDSSFDAREGRSYLAGADRDSVFALAREDLRVFLEYIDAIQQSGSEDGLVAFNALPVLLAYAALDKVEQDGPGAKISRDTVFGIMADLERALERGAPVVSLVRVRS